MRKFFDERGQTLIFVALGMTVLLGFVGFATDVGVLLHEKREVQTAADSAAIAGAIEALSEGNATAINSNITAAAKADAALNGFTDGTNGASVTITMTPNITVSTFNKFGYVQATITQSTPDFFMTLFGHGSTNVTATAVATELGEKVPCLNVYNGGGPGTASNPNPMAATPAVYLSGNSLLAGNKCGIPVNGSVLFNGGKATIQAGSLDAEGSISGNAGVSVTGPYASNLGFAPASDSSLAATLSDTTKQPTASGGSCTSPDGSTCYYDYGGGTITGPITLQPGVYYFDKAVTISGQVSGTGVTFFLQGDIPFDFAANGTMTVSAPTTGTTFQNVLIDAPTDGPYTTCKTGKGNNGNAGELFFDFGSSNTTLNGIVYAPNAQLFVQDSGATMNINADMVIGNVCMQSATFQINGLSAPTYTTKVGLVY